MPIVDKDTDCQSGIETGDIPQLGKGSMPLIGSGCVPPPGFGNMPMVGFGSIPPAGSGTMPLVGSWSMPLVGSWSHPNITKTDLPPVSAGENKLHGALGQKKPRKYDCVTDMGITSHQKRVLEWLVEKCGSEERKIIRFYKIISSALGITRKAAIVHVKALKKKGLIVSSPACSRGSNQRIGVNIQVTPAGLNIKFPQRFKIFPIPENDYLVRKNAQTLDLIKKRSAAQSGA